MIIRVTHAPDQSWSPSIEISPSDISQLINLIGGQKKDPYLDYSLQNVLESYDPQTIHWLELLTPRGIVKSPYELLIDYRKITASHWGTYKLSGIYELPGELSRHRERMVERFKKENKLLKGNNPAPRVSKFEVGIDGTPNLILEQAFYYDQVGSNLTLDFPLSKIIQVDGEDCSTVREWDIAQAKSNHQLPSFEKSKLANTIGVAIGIAAPSDEYGTVLLRRKRAINDAVYPGMWHVPFSFALSNELLEGRETIGEIAHLIKFDYGHELAEELGLENSDLGPAKPLAFCRDLIRGGKPQFFFELDTRISFEEIRRKVKDRTGEYSGNIEKFRIQGFQQDIDAGYSPELGAFTILKSIMS
jgi:hypothetical protein